ncbi:hypothetical protein EDC04DRAFT_250358 [Pisolithus marmoratus]|nr:hypothetical protein EDC04DRAFT_250358 [Pisolithus marmoratus]
MSTTINLKYLTNIPSDVRERLHEYVINCVADAVEFSRGNLFPYRPCCSPARLPEYVLLKAFVVKLIERSFVSVYGVALALVYIDRLKHQELLINHKGAAACERLFIGALMLAWKHLGDNSMTSYDWARMSLLFTEEEIEKLELQFIVALDHKLDVADYELLPHQQAISQIATSRWTPSICPVHDNSRPMRAHFWPAHHMPESTRTLPILEEHKRTLPALEEHVRVSDSRSPSKTPRRNYLCALFSRNIWRRRII